MVKATQIEVVLAKDDQDQVYIGPDGKPERVDDRPPIMNLVNSDLTKLPLPWKIMSWVVKLLSSPGTQRGKARLVTIRYSHYCDRARWALNYSPLEFTEDAHPPGIHVAALDSVTKGKWSRTPVLVLPDGEVVTDSTVIVQRLAALYPDSVGELYPQSCRDEVLELEAEMEIGLGANIRQVAYTHVLDIKYLSTGAPYLCKGTSVIEAFVYNRMKRMIAKGMIAVMRCRYSRIPKSEAELDDLFEKLAEKLQGGRKYLCGDGTKFTAADLTFASLAYPLVLPKEMMDAKLLPPLEQLPKQYATMVEKFRKTPAGQHALRMYKDHRFVNGQTQLIKPNIYRDQGLAKGLFMIAMVISLVVVQFYSLLVAFVTPDNNGPQFGQDNLHEQMPSIQDILKQN